jgi:hypothetical protein
MGRPLKIAKAQAILTITDTTAATDYVTVSQSLTNLGVIAGMPFIPASSTGNLVGGTTYYVLQVIDANNFTVSATQLSANPTYSVFALADTSGTTVAASVGVVDNGFNNPEGTANTYGVVGGNTAIYGNQVLTRVAIGVSGTGTIYTSDASDIVAGLGTDFGNISGLAAGSAIQTVDPVTGAVTDQGFISAVSAITEAITDTVATGNFVVTSGNCENFLASGPITFDANIGNIVTGTTYFIKSIANSTHFTVSLTQGGVVVPQPDDTDTSNATQDAFTLTANAISSVNNSAWIYANDEAGFIVRQKGKQKYLVTGATSGLTGACYTANLANTALTPNTMSILATYANTATQRVQSLSDINAELFTATSGPVATGNIVLANADPVFATFNSAVAANTANGLIYPLVQIASA